MDHVPRTYTARLAPSALANEFPFHSAAMNSLPLGTQTREARLLKSVTPKRCLPAPPERIADQSGSEQSSRQRPPQQLRERRQSRAQASTIVVQAPESDTGRTSHRAPPPARAANIVHASGRANLSLVRTEPTTRYSSFRHAKRRATGNDPRVATPGTLSPISRGASARAGAGGLSRHLVHARHSRARRVA